MVTAMLTSVALHAWMLVADPRSCSATFGNAQARVLVDRCLEVSPATHPPCNALNPCGLIIDEIRRGCAFLHDTTKPRFCALYSARP